MEARAHLVARTIQEIRKPCAGLQGGSADSRFFAVDWNGPERCSGSEAGHSESQQRKRWPRLYRQVRKGALYERSLELLRRAKEMHADVPTKTGMMLGLGEEKEEVLATMQDLAAQGTDILTLGQYLQPHAASICR